MREREREGGGENERMRERYGNAYGTMKEMEAAAEQSGTWSTVSLHNNISSYITFITIHSPLSSCHFH